MAPARNVRRARRRRRDVRGERSHLIDARHMDDQRIVRGPLFGREQSAHRVAVARMHAKAMRSRWERRRARRGEGSPLPSR